ncbi:hypothetical protein MADP07_00260 [Mycoplasma anatis]|uniref:Peptidase S8/S53 domain-containing protein n=1 Tax=Mycoplasmopsis anatis TaxID=171279 RepID=A0A9Q3L7J4_9BACT|nr:S8 family serine peptidase [Mycoplasmopsis anatis]MBW0595958.1 hypothetical protein [Mycoplasmopsis anatis]MBW0596677.1 hypothetical protein [Mycoplasmopsis anatis]MBW0599405.1 hypothetical protein [Mycoplasmopsis anatis]MBW0600243.1 hypothetical protein [Mycoplasmopsis anatis]MBW0602538.1 hypothetical protein [Mycoplasmopsis anatis]
MNKINKLPFLIIGGTALISPSMISVNINKKEQMSSKIIFENFGSFNIESLEEFDKYITNNEDFNSSLMIVLDNKVSYDRIKEIINEIKNFESVQNVYQSKVLENYLISNINDNKKIKQLIQYFENNRDITTVYINNQNEVIGNSINSSTDKFDYYKSFDQYSTNFNSNNYTKAFRDEIIENFRKYIDNNNNKRIGVGVLEVGDKTKWFNHHALINALDNYYFDTSKDTKQIVINDWSKFYVPRIWRITPQYGIHSTEVASIIGGKNGVNPLLKLYGVKLNLKNSNDVYKSLDDEISYLTKQSDVKIINNSWGFVNPGDDLYKYNSYARYFDEVAAKYPEVIFVFSAGNDGGKDVEQQRKLNGAKLSYNSIIVGANDNDGRKTYFSSHNSDTGKNVLLLANGYNYNFKDAYKKGTSYAAPFISGVIGNTLVKYEKQYNYGKNNIIAMSTLAVSTSNEKNDKSNNQSKLDSKTGGGILDYSKLDQAFNNLKYIKWLNGKSKINNIDNNSNTDKKELIINELKIEQNKTVRMSLAWEFDGKSFVNNDKTKPNVNDFDLFLYDENNELVALSRDEKNNMEFIKFQSKSGGNYKIKIVNYTYNAYEDNDLEIALTWTVE